MVVSSFNRENLNTAQPSFTGSKSTMEIPEQCVKTVQSGLERNQNDINNIFLVPFHEL